jgi:hypothetical protein
LIEDNGGRRHAAPTPSELGKEQEEEEDKVSIPLNFFKICVINLLEKNLCHRNFDRSLLLIQDVCSFQN